MERWGGQPETLLAGSGGSCSAISTHYTVHSCYPMQPPCLPRTCRTMAARACS